MKRWLSISFALGAFLGVLLVSVFALYKLQLGSLNVAAAPVAAQPPAASVPQQNDNYSQAVLFFKDRGVALSTSPTAVYPWASWNTYSADADPHVSQAASVLQSEWSKYGAEVLKHSGLKKIYLVNNLIVDDQHRAGMPDPIIDHALYFDVSDKYLQSENGDYMRRTMHHEFSHLIEYDLFGSYAPKDQAWDSCNAPDTIYGDGGFRMYDNPDFAHKMHPSYGFIDGYATSAPEEDKAEMFSYLMTDPSYLQNLANEDAGIACKLNLVEQLLQKL